MGNFFAAIYCQSEPCKSDCVVFYNSLACRSHSVGPRDRRPSRIQIASQRHIRSCRGGHNRSQWELVPNLRGLSYAMLYNLRFKCSWLCDGGASNMECKCLRPVDWFVVGAHVTEICGLVGYRWCDGLIFAADLIARVYIFVCFLPITRESIVCRVLTAYWLRIDRVLNRSQICNKWGPGKSIAKQYSVSKWPRTQIFSYQVTHRLEHSVPRWPGDSNVQSLGGPGTRKFSLWVPPRDSNMQSSRDPEEGEEEGRRVWL